MRRVYDFFVKYSTFDIYFTNSLTVQENGPELNCAEHIECIETLEMPNLPENLEQLTAPPLDAVASQYVLKINRLLCFL